MQVTKQLAIFLENKPGALARLCDAMAEEQINILAVSVVDGVDHAVVRMVVDRPEKAIYLLEGAGILVSENEVIMFDAPNRPGMLLDIAGKLSKAKINIEYLYCAVQKNQKKGTLVLRPSNLKKALSVLSEIG
jgi:hypothetical protein